MATKTNTLTEIEEMILAECDLREKEIAVLAEPPKWRTWDHREWSDLKKYGPAYSSAEWFGDERGNLPEKIRSRILRAIRSLEVRDLIIATNNGTRLGWLKLTEKGRAALPIVASNGGETQ